MPRIQQLPPSVVTKIAAGEVIERPSSVVKELLENSVDAGSTRIDIDLEQGGTELIRVVDDGCGIAADDLPLAFASHATSKLRTAEDLFAIATMGFRGEALASIAGVAKVTLQSRTHDQPSGSELRCDGGELSAVRPWNGSPGTRVEVRHLFFNVPVRKKFLKSIATELGHVCEAVTRLALANPALHLTLRHNGKLVYDIPASAGLLDRIGLFFTREVRDALYELDSGPELSAASADPARPPGRVSGLRLTGYIADPKCDRGNAKLQYLFVNGRWFRDRSVGHALQESYRGLLMTGRYAVGFLFLTLPPDKVDVNVHPTKAEVRFQENSLIYSLVRSTVKSRLLKENLVPRLEVPAGQEPGAWGQETESRRRETAEPRPSLFPPRDNSVLSTQYSVLPTMPSPRQELAERTVAPWERPEDRGSPEPIAPPARQNPEPATPEPAPLPVAA
ncbi:MAG TPA: DNA mismatch repair endonuclease MutL, partial [Gemmataceae bacterium]|nr:DNA mismatch repair endonuclease MutL [Gemmataceae bacterium]